MKSANSSSSSRARSGSVRTKDAIALTGWRTIDVTMNTGTAGSALDVGWYSPSELAVLQTGSGGETSVIKVSQDGATATDIGMLTELSWGMPLRSYSRTRGWSADEFDRSECRLRDLGYLDGEGSDTRLSQQGRHTREQIEVATDDQMRPALDAIGDDIEELFDILAPWGETIRAGKGYLGAGPHDLG